MDHHVDLWFYGIVDNDEQPRHIVLSWGEFDGEGKEVLWNEN